MGNSSASSCAPSITISNGGSVKLFHSDGTLRIYTKQLKAAELRVENPGKFVCDYSNLKIGQRIQSLSADEELERRRVYFLLPMDLLYSVLTQEEMRILRFKAGKALKLNQYLSRIFPVLVNPLEINKATEISSLATKTASAISSSLRSASSATTRSFCKQRSWRPALETIVETPCRSVS